jgi:CheY-like chemotaxis protein
VIVEDLQEAGYEVTALDDATAALALFERRRPSVLLLDMTAGPGPASPIFAAAALLRPPPSIVGLAPFGYAGAVADALALGACCCLRLPIDGNGLLEAVESAAALVGPRRRPSVSSPEEG